MHDLHTTGSGCYANECIIRRFLAKSITLNDAVLTIIIYRVESPGGPPVCAVLERKNGLKAALQEGLIMKKASFFTVCFVSPSC